MSWLGFMDLAVRTEEAQDTDVVSDVHIEGGCEAMPPPTSLAQADGIIGGLL